jgi:hypothetical protein
MIMAKRRKENPLTPKQKRHIKNAFRKNKNAIDKVLKGARTSILKSHDQLRDWLLGNGGEDPKAVGDGRP